MEVIYGPALTGLWGALGGVFVSSLAEAWATAVMESSTDRNKNEQLITSMYDRYKQFDKSVDQMRDAIVERSRKLAEHTSAVTNKRFQWLKWKQNNQYK